MSLIYRLKFRFSECARIKAGFGLSPLRTRRELKSLIDFCYAQLQEEHIQKYNLKKKAVFQKTIELYNNDDVHVNQYIREHMEYYWS